MSVTLSRRLFTAEEFRGMAEVGLLREDDRLELVNGVIVEMAPIGHRHASCVRKLNELFHELLAQVHIDVQNPLGISREDDFYPDIVLLKRREDGYAGNIPEAKDALLVVEVADTTLEYDRTVKLPRYAAAGVREVWIVDLQAKRIWVHRKPLEGDYGEVFEACAGDVLTVSAIPGFEVKVDDILP
jgi:Uma2 family endonuclease